MSNPFSGPIAPDRFKVPAVLWRWLDQSGLEPSRVLRHARLPVTLLSRGSSERVSTAQYFALWRSIDDLASSPALGLRIAQEVDVAHMPPANIAAYYASDFRDGLTRLARYKQLCVPEEMRIAERGGECRIENAWLHATEAAPQVLVDAAFASLVELGRRGTKTHVRPIRVELQRKRDPKDPHSAYFGATVRFGATKDVIVFQAADLDRPFPSHNSEFLTLLEPTLGRVLREGQSEASLAEQAKMVLRHHLAGRRPDMEVVARELGVSSRTLQRRLSSEGLTFQEVLGIARHDFALQYLTQPGMELKEVAFLLGYEEATSFNRAFRKWEGTPPARWRSINVEKSGN